jgi:methionine-gamma-lyase
MMKNNIRDFSKLGDQTKAVHAGEFPDPVTGASSPNLTMSTTFVVDAGTTFSVEGMGADDPFVYTRWGNPTIRQLDSWKAFAGNGIFRLSVGLEDADDLIADLEQALA